MLQSNTLPISKRMAAIPGAKNRTLPHSQPRQHARCRPVGFKASSHVWSPALALASFPLSAQAVEVDAPLHAPLTLGSPPAYFNAESGYAKCVRARRKLRLR